MDIKTLKLSVELGGFIQALRLQVEIHEKVNIRANRSLAELVELIKIAKSSLSSPVLLAWKKLEEHLNLSQRAILKQAGVEVKDEAPLVAKTKGPVKTVSSLYRGVKVEKEIPTGTAEEKKPPGKKRKVVYRGQVKWI